MSKHAVLTDDSLVAQVIRNGKNYLQSFLVSGGRTFADLWELGQLNGVTHFWIMPDSHLDRAGSAVLAPVDTYELWYPRTDSGTAIDSFVRTSKKGVYNRNVYLCWPARAWRWDIATPLDILSTITYLEKALGVTVQWGPGHMSESLLSKIHTNGKHMSWIEESTIDLMKLPFTDAARDVVWKSSDFCNLQVGMYLHSYDKNSQYLAAMTGGTNGCGTPQHRRAMSGPDLPGIYRVTFSPGESVFDGKLLPLIIEDDQKWVTQDIVKLALMNDYIVKIQEAYVFEEGHRVLKDLAYKLWDARCALKTDTVAFPYAQGRENAYDTTKEIAVIGGGRLATEKFHHKFMRPNWWSDFVGRAREAVLRNLYKWYAQGYLVALVYYDGVYVSSSEQNPLRVLPGLPDAPNTLGGYKYEGTLEITPEIIEKFHMMDAGALQGWLAKQYKQQAKEQVAA